MAIDDTGSVEGIYAFIYCTKWRSGQVSRMPDSLTTLKDRATQLLIKYKSGALVTQKQLILPFHPGLPWLAADKVVALNVPVRDFSFCLFKDIMFWFSSYFKIKPLVAAALYL